MEKIIGRRVNYEEEITQLGEESQRLKEERERIQKSVLTDIIDFKKLYKTMGGTDFTRTSRVLFSYPFSQGYGDEDLMRLFKDDEIVLNPIERGFGFPLEEVDFLLYLTRRGVGAVQGGYSLYVEKMKNKLNNSPILYRNLELKEMFSRDVKLDEKYVFPLKKHWVKGFRNVGVSSIEGVIKYFSKLGLMSYRAEKAEK